jgi:hypothetical protein
MTAEGGSVERLRSWFEMAEALVWEFDDRFVRRLTAYGSRQEALRAVEGVHRAEA